ncbi:Nucleotide-binding alpha-beta plait [Penicillium citrinum]|uniref:Nucleotide-binding alpha-beta plait n=1 Tax=Penicillium citrinum TaxID=5077 RepID=A0A9W9PCW3_PENCI|nr:Nucleotide-binding alpha-beta plait [Penicillium citrinum]KAJ5240582.1 Nucleotide-binding alpha-beta plait [Penicillium citrinum]
MASYKFNKSENSLLIIDGSNSMMPSQSPPASKPATRRGPPTKPKQSGHALWVGNISSSVNVSDLKEHFSQGAREEIQNVFFISQSNCAFVNYRSAASCVAALARFHGSELYGLRVVCHLRKGLETPESPNGPPGLQVWNSSSPIASLRNETSGITTRQPKLTISLSENRYFIIKSLTVEDLETSKDMRIWSTQSHNELRLSQAYESAVNVYLIFSANKSGEYFGYARMSSSITDDDLPRKAQPRTQHSLGEIELILTPTLKTPTAPAGRIVRDTARGTVFWEAMPLGNNDCGSRIVYEQATWPEFSSLGKPFSVTWLSDDRVRFSRTRGLRNPWNAHREVKIARDGTELEPSVG